MDCENTINLISARLDGEISCADLAILEAHLQACACCRATAEAFQLQDGELRQAFDAPRQSAVALAERVADHVTPPIRPERSTPAVRQAPRWWRLAVAALLIAGVAALLLSQMRPSHRSTDREMVKDDANDPLLNNGLVPRPRQTPPAASRLGVGETVETPAAGKRRVVLPDGSVLLVNSNSKVRVEGERQISLENGEVFIEVAKPQAAEAFVVKTAQREIAAHGTRFAVRADAGQTSVFVTQGMIKVAGIDPFIGAGQQLEPNATAPTESIRASCALDWTRELLAEAETPLVPGSEFAGGALIAVDANGQEAKLSLRNYHIDVHIEDGFARTTIDQTYFNHTPWRLEGTFYFPLPADASLNRLAMYVNGTLMEGGMAERERAAQVYETIKRSMRDPALLEWVDGTTFKMRVFPLEGRQEKRIILSYVQRLPVNYGQTLYRFPAGHTLARVDQWSFHAVVKNGASMVAQTPSHPDMKIERGKEDLTFDASAKNAALDRDVVLELVETGDHGGLTPRRSPADVRFTTHEQDGHRYLMVRYRPALPVAAKRKRTDWVFLFESSADRDPLLARVQVEIVRNLLEHAEHDDRFAIVTANSRVQTFAPELLPVTTDNVGAAIEFLDRAHLVGALNLGEGLDEAAGYLSAARGAAGKHTAALGGASRLNENAVIVHVGGGFAALGDKRADSLIERIPARAHYVGVGVGKDWSRSFMKRAAEKTGGYFTQINPDESIAWRSFELASTLGSPRMLDLKVTDDKGSPFLTIANAISQGEEICALTRVDGEQKLPASVRIVGSVDGQPFEHTLTAPRMADPAEDGKRKAGYLPRAWARLEIDRMLAEDSEKNKNRIIELSKDMYVMSPFTSLLVLENEEMYKEFKVDRGRKDHWAMYPCPDKIKVVYEPLADGPVDVRNAPKQQGEKPHRNVVVRTVVTREGMPLVPDAVIKVIPIEGDAQSVVATLRDMFLETRTGELSIQAHPELRAIIVRGTKENAALVSHLTRAISRADTPLGDPDRAIDSPPIHFPPVEKWPRRAGRLKLADMDPWNPSGRSADGPSQTIFFAEGYGDAKPREKDSFFERRKLPPEITDVRSETTLAEYNRLMQESTTYRLQGGAARDKSIGLMKQLKEVEGMSRARSLVVLTPSGDPKQRELWDEASMLTTESTSANARPPVYSRPSFSGNAAVFTDLLAYAPGMNTSGADLQAALEAEAAPQLSALPGRIDPAARKLIDKARTGGWQEVVLLDADGKPVVTVFCNGGGSYNYERKLALGLDEQVHCDGDALLHLYPELGIGAQRVVSRFHRAEFQELVPWLLPPADDMAYGADVRYVDERTVAIVSVNAGRIGDPSYRYVIVHLVFDEGRLAERRLIEMPGSKVVAREVYSRDAVRLLDADGKEVQVHKFKVSSLQEARDARPDTSKHVIVPLPWRSREKTYPPLELNANMGLERAENQCFRYLRGDRALQVFTTLIGEGRGWDALEVYRYCMHEHGDRRLGYFTLLAAAGMNVADMEGFCDHWDAYKGNPLAQYLMLATSLTYQRLQKYCDLKIGATVGPEGSFLQQLAEFRGLYLRWQVDADSVWFRMGAGKREAASFGFVRKHKDDVLGYLLLTVIEDRIGRDARMQERLAGAWVDFAKPQAATQYVARYERGRCLFKAGRGDEARRVFLDLFEEAVKEHRLPLIDGACRDALRSADGDPWAESLLSAARKWIAGDNRVAVVYLAWLADDLDDLPLAGKLLTMALDGAAAGEPAGLVQTYLAAVEYLRHDEGARQSRAPQALELVEELLKQEKRVPMLWRLASVLADDCGKMDRSIACLEKALDLEYRDLPDVIDLEQLRHDYGRLLHHYERLMESSRDLQSDAPRDLAARVIRAADRWRALDHDTKDPSTQAASMLADLGLVDLAWDYLTTQYATSGRTSDPWPGWKDRHNGLLSRAVLAERVLTVASEEHPDDLNLLWERAEALKELRREEQARGILQKIAAAKAPDGQEWYRSRARKELEGR